MVSVACLVNERAASTAAARSDHDQAEDVVASESAKTENGAKARSPAFHPECRYPTNHRQSRAEKALLLIIKRFPFRGLICICVSRSPRAECVVASENISRNHPRRGAI